MPHCSHDRLPKGARTAPSYLTVLILSAMLMSIVRCNGLCEKNSISATPVGAARLEKNTDSIHWGSDIFVVIPDIVLEIQYVSDHVHYNANRWIPSEKYMITFQRKGSVPKFFREGNSFEQIKNGAFSIKTTKQDNEAIQKLLTETGLATISSYLMIRTQGAVDPFFLALGKVTPDGNRYALLNGRIFTIGNDFLVAMENGLGL